MGAQLRNWVNGGTVDIIDIGYDQIFVDFEFVFGPTYHFASFRGLAQKIAPGVYEHKSRYNPEVEECHLTFTFLPKNCL